MLIRGAPPLREPGSVGLLWRDFVAFSQAGYRHTVNGQHAALLKKGYELVYVIVTPWDDWVRAALVIWKRMKDPYADLSISEFLEKMRPTSEEPQTATED